MAVLATVGCSLVTPAPKLQNPNRSFHLHRFSPLPRTPLRVANPSFLGRSSPVAAPLLGRSALLLRRRSSADGESPGGPALDDEAPAAEVSGGGGDGGQDWTTSVLLFGFWAALMYYVFQLAPNQTPSRDMYFLQKLLNLTTDDGFRMNQVLVSLWYIMGLWPLVYSMLLLPSGRSSRSKVPVWPFLVLSFFGGAYALIPYFVLWKPPPPAFDEEEIGSWPLNFLESKITAVVSLQAFNQDLKSNRACYKEGVPLLSFSSSQVFKKRSQGKLRCYC